MPIIYWNNGFSDKLVGRNYIPRAGEVMVSHRLAEDRLLEYFPGRNAATEANLIQSRQEAREAALQAYLYSRYPQTVQTAFGFIQALPLPGIKEALQELVPMVALGVGYTLPEGYEVMDLTSAYAQMVWLDESPKPSLSEVQDVRSVLVAAALARRAQIESVVNWMAGIAAYDALLTAAIAAGGNPGIDFLQFDLTDPRVRLDELLGVS